MNRKLTLFLACVLVLAVGWNLVNTFRVRKDFEGVIDTLQSGSCKVKASLEACYARSDYTSKESQYWMKKYQALRNSSCFPEDMMGCIDTLVKLSRVVNCCYVPPEEAQDIALTLVKMRPGLLRYKAFIEKFFEVKDE